jgi:hypothetical protein
MARLDDEFEYEEITHEEVDHVLAVLEELTGKVASETIRAFLEECSTNVYYLVYDDEEDDLSSAA